MAFTKIINSGEAVINLPSAIGGGTLAVGANVVVAYDIQTVGAAMEADNIIHYGMLPVEAGGGSSGSISSNPGTSYSNSDRPAASNFAVGAAVWNTSDNAYNYSDGTNWRDAAGNIT